MNLIRYNYPETSVADAFDRLFENALRAFGDRGSFFDGALSGPATPAVDLFEDEDNYYARFELPGYKKADINVELNNGNLRVSGERETGDADKENARATVGRFSRVISVPEGVDADKVKANYEDGILTIALGKAEARKPRTIAVK